MNVKQDNKKEMSSRLAFEELYFPISVCTKQPYVYCDPDTYDDVVFLFTNKEHAEHAAHSMTASGEQVQLVCVKRAQFPFFCESMRVIGVNAFVWGAQGTEEKAGEGGFAGLLCGGVCTQLDDILAFLEQSGEREAALQQDEPKPAPVENPALCLTALYLAQCMRAAEGTSKTRATGEKGSDNARMQELLEEMLAHFQKGTYLMPIRDENQIPLMRFHDDRVYQPICTDAFEFQRFNQDGACKAIAVPCEKIHELLAKEANGVLLNPATVALPINLERQGK